MTKKCELTGKRPLKGHKVSHANNKVKRRFLPGIKKVNFKSDILNKSLRLNVSNSAMRSIDKKGSFDQFMKEVNQNIYQIDLKKLKKVFCKNLHNEQSFSNPVFFNGFGGFGIKLPSSISNKILRFRSIANLWRF